MYANETSAYKRMWTQANKVHREQFAVIEENNVLVLPEYKNNMTTTETDIYGYIFKNSKLVDPISKSSLSVLGTIHTHQDDLGRKWGFIAQPGVEDRQTFSSKTPGIPFFTM